MGDHIRLIDLAKSEQQSINHFALTCLVLGGLWTIIPEQRNIRPLGALKTE